MFLHMPLFLKNETLKKKVPQVFKKNSFWEKRFSSLRELQTAQLHEVIDSLGCCNLRTDGTHFVLTRAWQSGRQPQRRP